jgi:hypothetical protein
VISGVTIILLAIIFSWIVAASLIRFSLNSLNANRSVIRKRRTSHLALKEKLYSWSVIFLMSAFLLTVGLSNLWPLYRKSEPPTVTLAWHEDLSRYIKSYRIKSIILGKEEVENLSQTYNLCVC